VTGAIAQRLAGSGQIFRTFIGGGCSDRGVLELDLRDARHVVQQLPLDVLQSSDPLSHDWAQPQAPPAQAEPEVPLTAEELSRQAYLRQNRAARTEQRRGLLRDFLQRPVDGVIIVAGDDEADLADEAIDVGLSHLSPGGRFVVLGHHLQPMAARQGALRSSGDFVDVRLTQLFTREFQILPQRTHPEMSAEANLCEGFLLAASKVATSSATSSKHSGEAAQESEAKRQRTNCE